jgi:folate-binding protein YgfZ
MAHGAFLTGRGGVVAMGLFRRLPDGFLFLVPPGQAGAAAEHVEKFHFAERLQVEDVSRQWATAGLWNLSGPVPKGLDPLHIQPLEGGFAFRDDARPPLHWVTMEKARFSAYLAALGAPQLGYRLFEYFRIDAAVPQAGVELGERDIILEGNFDRAVARNKGCYPGQEVVERIYTYGQVNRKLLPITLEAQGGFPPTPFTLRAGDAEIAQTMSLAELPGDRCRAVGLAFVRRTHWDYRAMLTADGGVVARLR